MFDIIKDKNIKKDNGGVLDFIPMLLTIVVIMVLLLVYASWIRNLELKSEVDTIARNYLLQMETTGHLTPAAQESLRNDLEKIGMSSIDFKDTTVDEVNYGNTILLEIEGNLAIRDYQYLDFFTLDKESGTIRVKIYLTSTAKH